MTKAEFIAAIVEKTNLAKTDVETVYSAIFDTIADALSKQDKIAIPGFGNFATKIREERKGRNPSTGKEIIIPRAVVANFKVASQLKDKLNSEKSE